LRIGSYSINLIQSLLRETLEMLSSSIDPFRKSLVPPDAAPIINWSVVTRGVELESLIMVLEAKTPSI